MASARGISGKVVRKAIIGRGSRKYLEHWKSLSGQKCTKPFTPGPSLKKIEELS
jgi:hypothetical protein